MAGQMPLYARPTGQVPLGAGAVQGRETYGAYGGYGTPSLGMPSAPPLILRLATAAEDELECIADGGGAECTVAFNDAWDRAETRERDAVLRHRSLLRRWVNQHKKSGSR